MLQKAADKAQSETRSGHQPPRVMDNWAEAKEAYMANDTFMKPEVPEQMRDAMKTSIEQAKRAFDTFAATSEQTWKSFESNTSTTPALRSLTSRIAEITRTNAEANFALALKLTESKDLGQAMQLQADYLREQMDTFFRQLEEIRDLATQVFKDSASRMPNIGDSMAGPKHGMFG
jgi:phasin